MPSRTVRPRRRALAVSAFAAFTALACGGLITAAILVPAPVAALPLLAIACVGLPMLAAWQLASVHAALGGLRAALRRAPRHRPLDESALHDLRRWLARLPETAHPLDD